MGASYHTRTTSPNAAIVFLLHKFRKSDGGWEQIIMPRRALLSLAWNRLLARIVNRKCSWCGRRKASFRYGGFRYWICPGMSCYDDLDERSAEHLKHGQM